MRIVKIALPLLSALMLHSCFTGIESTPRITGKDVRRNDALETAEQMFAGSIKREPFRDWKPGKRFLVVDERLSMLLNGNQTVKRGDTLCYIGYSDVVTFTADTATMLNFKDMNAQLQLRLDQSPGEIEKSPSLELPFTVDFSLVALADSLMRNRQFYILTPSWVSSGGNSENGRRFVPVTIESVAAGNDGYPLHVLFKTADGIESGVMMTAGPERTATRNFDKIFSFDDPHLKYSQISEEMWAKIRQGILCEGMTKEESRLAAGAPSDIRKGQDGTSYFERWYYENGGYLIFVDGILDSFRM